MQWRPRDTSVPARALLLHDFQPLQSLAWAAPSVPIARCDIQLHARVLEARPLALSSARPLPIWFW